MQFSFKTSLFEAAAPTKSSWKIRIEDTKLCFRTDSADYSNFFSSIQSKKSQVGEVAIFGNFNLQMPFSCKSAVAEAASPAKSSREIRIETSASFPSESIQPLFRKSHANKKGFSFQLRELKGNSNPTWKNEYCDCQTLSNAYENKSSVRARGNSIQFSANISQYTIAMSQF